MKKIITGLLVAIILTGCSNKIKDFEITGSLTEYGDWSTKNEKNINENYFSVKNNSFKFVRDGENLNLIITIKREEKHLPHKKLDLEESVVWVDLWADVDKSEQMVVEFELKDVAKVKQLYNLPMEEEMEVTLSADPKMIKKFDSLSNKPFEKQVDKEYARLWLCFEC